MGFFLGFQESDGKGLQRRSLLMTFTCISKVTPVNSDGKLEISHLQLKIHLHSLSIFQLPILESCMFCIQSVTEQPFYSTSYIAFRHNKPTSISLTPRTPQNPVRLQRLQCLARRVVCWTSQNLETKHCGNPRQRWGLESKTGWWFQPIWEICSSNWKSSPNRGENVKYLSCHQPEKVFWTTPWFLKQKKIWFGPLFKALKMEKWQKWRPLFL